MIFYRELDYQHYLYNGKDVIAINPDRVTLVPWKYKEDEPEYKSKLDQALNSRARGFAALARFQIIQRGQFYTDTE